MQDEITPEQAKEWRQREQARLDDGTYTRLPCGWLTSHWYGDPNTPENFHREVGYCHTPRFPDHFAHVSVEKVAMIAFTENDKKGVADRQTRMTPGRYLTRFYSEWLTKLDIQHLSTQMGADYNDDAELFFAKTAAEFEEVYTEGPSSCMSHPARDYSSPVHPVRVYAGFDLELAYLKRDNRITARALVWPMRKIYGRIYGDEVRLVKKLADAGYKSGSLGGARITRLKHKKYFVIPYLDHLEGATDEGDHLVLSEDDYGCCGSGAQNGLSGGGYTCVCCDEHISEGNDINHDGDHYCSDCHTDRFWQCDRTGDYINSDDESSTEVRVVRSNFRRTRWEMQYWCQHAVDAHAFFCGRDEVYYSDDNDSVEVQGETWGPEAVARDAVEIDGEWYDRDDAPTETQETYGPIYSPSSAPGVPGIVQHEPQPIAVGDWVECISDCTDVFTTGCRYKVTRVYMEGSMSHLVFEANDRGQPDGWWTKYFRRVAEVHNSGWHIRHEPARVSGCPHVLYNGDAYYDAWPRLADAEQALVMLSRREATNATNNLT